MAIPVYLWLKDEGGTVIRGGVDVDGRERSIEVTCIQHGVELPGTASEGCIVIGPMTRREIWASGDTALRVK